MKVLFITHHYLGDNGGGCFASRAYINAFAELADEVTLLYPIKEKCDAKEIDERVKKIPVWYDKYKVFKLFDLLIGKVHRYSDLFNIIDVCSFDIVVFDTSLVSYRLIKGVKERGCKTIVIHHNYQYEYFRDNTKGLLKIPVLFWCRKYESQAIQYADINLTLTKQDTTLLKDAYGNKGCFEKIGVFEYKRSVGVTYESDNKKDSIPTFVITGSLGSFQNHNPIMRWLSDYYPYMLKIVPNHNLIIAGRNPLAELIQYTKQYHNITIMPNPVSMDEIMKSADYYICPTDIGGGLKLRIMDGLKYGLPVLTHVVSARGYDEFEKCGMLVSYDSIKSFENGLNGILYTNENKRDVIFKYKTIFSFDAGIKRLESIIVKL